MKKILIVLLFIYSIANNWAITQVWAPLEAEWYNYYTETGWGGPIAEGYYYMNVEGDTMINGISCRNISRHIMHADGVYESLTLPLFTYFENNKVYYLQNGQFYILYDFAAEIGDSWTSRNPWEFFNCTPPEPDEDTLSTYTVDSVRYVNINGITLRQIYVQSSTLWSFGGYISERIGCLGFIIPGQWQFWDPPVEGTVRCYSDSEINYTTLIPCDTLITGLNEESGNTYNFTVFPNPFHNEIRINSSEGIKSIRLYDIYGIDQPFNFTEIATGQYILDTKNLNKGFYFINSEFKNYQVNLKIIKQ